jgi:hypothetical protein
MKKLTFNLTEIENSSDRILEIQASNTLLRYYVPVEKGHNEYFTRADLAMEFADLIRSTVKTLD